MSDPPTNSSPSPRKRSRLRRIIPRRWPGRVFLGIILLLVLAVVITQIVLSTNIPRDLVLRQLERQLGLRISVASLSTSWLGNTDLRDVTISLPLASESFVTVPEMRVEHNTLFGLLWSGGGDVTIDAIELDRPDILIRQDDAGRWNVQQVADMLLRAGGKQPAAEQAKRTPRPELPALRVRDGRMRVIDNKGRTATLEPVNVTGDPEDAVTWKYDATIGDVGSPSRPGLQITGRLAPGAPWAHEVNIRGNSLQTWAQPWSTAAPPPAVSLAVEWRGQMVPDGIAGRMVIGSLDIAGAHASGSLAAEFKAGTLALLPESVFVKTGRPAVPDMRLVAGRFTFDDKWLAAEQVMVLMLDGTAFVNARYDVASGSADVSGKWNDFAFPDKNIRQGGSFSGSVRHPFPGKPVVEAHLVTKGAGTALGWDADLALGGTGTGWDSMNWELKANRLSISIPAPIELDGLAANLQTRGQVISLTSLRGPGVIGATGKGQYDLASREWSVRLDLSNLPRPAVFGKPDPLSFTLNARGAREYTIFNNPGISLRGSEAEVRFDGSYVFGIPKPVDAHLYLNHIPRRGADTDQPPLFGYLHGEAHMTGTALNPRNLEITGILVGREIRFFDRAIGEIEAHVKGIATDEKVELSAEKLQLLGGTWQIDALYPQKSAIGVNLVVKQLPLKEIGAALHQPMLEGVTDAACTILVRGPRPEAVTVTADIKARDVKYGSQFSADTLEATALLADGNLKVDPIRLRKGQGQAELTAEMDVREYRRVSASIAMAAWPFEPTPGTKAELWGGSSGLRLSFPGAKRAEGVRRGVFRPESTAARAWLTGPLDLRAALTLNDKPAGDIRLLAEMRGRTLDLRSISYEGLEGALQGEAVIDFDRPYQTRGGFFFENFDGARVHEYFPENDAFVGLVGRYNGRVRITPAPGPRPLAPLRIQAEIENEKGYYRTIEIGPIRISAFTDLDRLVIEDSPENQTTIALAGGLVRVWGRMSMLDPKEELRADASMSLLISQMQLSAGGLDLDQIVHAFKPDADLMVGKLNVSFEALAGTRPGRRPGAAPSGQSVFEKFVRRLTADGRLDLSASDLGNLDVVAFLYNSMNIQPESGPIGYGDMSFHLEDGMLSLNNIHYFNRGTELRGIVDIDELWRMPDSKISGTVVGTARPFRDVRLPFLSSYDLDTIFTALQGDLATVAVTGKVNDPRLKSLAFSDLGEGMRNLIIGDFAHEKQKQKKEQRR